MSTCQGNKGGTRHNGGLVYRCPKCGSIGCTASGCTNQNFQSSRCMKCGKVGNPDRL